MGLGFEPKLIKSCICFPALETFLNVEPDKPPCRDLVVRLLSILWKILALFRSQKKYKFYSSSLLIAYDTNRLRRIVREFENNIFDRHKRLPPTRCRTYSAGASSLESQTNKTGMKKFLMPKSNSPTAGSPTRSPKHRTLDRLMGLQRSISLTKLSGKSKMQEERSVYEDYRVDRSELNEINRETKLRHLLPEIYRALMKV